MTVHAVANPQKFGLSYPALHDRAPGYGLITFDKPSGRIELTNLRRFDGQPYPGWPIAIDIWRNGLAATRHSIPLPRSISGLIQVVPDSPNAKPTYTVYAAKPVGRLPVWEPGRYRVLLNRRAIGTFTASS
jgi:hypothetical protein